MTEIKNNKEFTIIKESESPKNIQDRLTSSESIILCYDIGKGFLLFTDKRVLIGSTEKKTQTYTIPYGSITMYLTEKAKGLRDQGLLQIWTNSGPFKFHLKKSIHVQDLESTLATYLL